MEVGEVSRLPVLASQMTRYPVISVLIPTYGRPNSLSGALRSVLSQETDFLFEVVVLDNGCDSGLKADIHKITQSIKIPVSYVPVPDVGLHNARHAGVREAKSDLLVFVDDDITAGKGWLRAIIDTFNDPTVHMVGGPSLPSYEEDPPNWLNAFWTKTPDGKSRCGSLSLIDYGTKECEIEHTLIWGLNFAIRKETIISLGGFHPDSFPWDFRRFRGDGESAVSLKAKQQGLKAVYQPKAIVNHVVPKSRMTIEYFERRSFLQGISDSFADIRRAHALEISELRRKKVYWRLPIHMIKRIIGHNSKTASRDIYQNIKLRIRKAHKAGFAFHQQEVKCDHELLRWVLKDDYWSARITVDR